MSDMLAIYLKGVSTDYSMQTTRKTATNSLSTFGGNASVCGEIEIRRVYRTYIALDRTS